MNMTQYQNYTFADSDQFNTPPPENPKEEEDEYEAKLKEQLATGEISEGQYNTLTHTNKTVEDFLPEIGQPTEEEKEEPSTPQEQAPQYQVDASY